MEFSWRVSQLVAGENHTLVLTDNGKLFAWGKGMFGRLGTGNNDDRYVPTEIKIESQSAIISIAAGSYHSLALTDDGTIWSWGFNDPVDGQLGYGDITDSGPNFIANFGKLEETTNVTSDQDLEGENSKDASSANTKGISNLSKVINVSAGGTMSCAIDDAGVLWMWGNCPQPESELMHMNIFPKPVRSLQGLVVVKVACGSDHVVVLAEGQSSEMTGRYVCYAWGSNKYGQLGLGDCKSRDFPERIQSLDGHTVGKVDQICCGAYHTAVLTHNDNDEHHVDLLRRSMCWTFGMGENGQLGHGTSQSVSSPKLVHGLPEDEKLVSIACGLFHTGVVTASGHIWTWGMEQGLGLCPGIGPPGVGAGDYMYPVRLQASRQFDDYRHEKLVCGAAHTVVSSNGGTSMFAWGRGLNGLLGTGQSVDSIIPLGVVWPPSDPNTVNSTDEPTQTQLDLSSTSDSDMDKMLALAQKEICILTTELAGIKEHMRLVHASLYGTNEAGSSSDNMALEALDKMIANSSYDGLLHLDNFYRQARARVKAVLLQKKVEQLCHRFMQGANADGMDKLMHNFR